MSLRRFDHVELKRRRIASGKKPELLALIIERTKEAYIAYETGRTVPPTPVVLALCDELDCSPDDLLRPVDDGAEREAAARLRAASRRAQGLPDFVEDPAALDDAAELLRRHA